MATSKPSPTSEELSAALDWIKSHKKRSVAHILILLLMAAPTAVFVAFLAASWLQVSNAVAFTVAVVYFGLIALGLLIF